MISNIDKYLILDLFGEILTEEQDGGIPNDTIIEDMSAGVAVAVIAIITAFGKAARRLPMFP